MGAMPWQNGGNLPTLPTDGKTGRPVRQQPEGGWPRFSMAEVEKHIHLSDAWVVIHGRVYDITTFAVTHPGFNNAGQVSTALAIHRVLGTDCTEEFQSIHSPSAWRELADFQIGVVCDDDGKEQPRSTVERSAAPPEEHPVPDWLGKSRDFWIKYAGGADPEVVDYCERLREKRLALSARRRSRVSEVAAPGPVRRAGGGKTAPAHGRQLIVACALAALVPVLAPGLRLVRAKTAAKAT